MKISLKKIFESGSIIDHQPDPKSSRKWMGSMSEKFIIVDAQNAADIITIYVKPIKEKQEFVGEDFGAIEIKKIKAHYGKCLGGYRVSFSEAESGWGPILYEIALEIATNLSVGLTSDRLSVSAEAERVWDKFMTRKNYPVNIIQLDDINADQDEKLTPNDYTDDCIMPDGGDSIAIKKLKNLHTKKMVRKSIFSKNNNLLQKKDPLDVNKIEKGSLTLLDSPFSPLSNIENEKQEYLNNPLTKLYQSYSYGIPTIDSLIRSKKIFFTPNAAFIIKKLRLEPKYDPVLKSNNVHENKRYKLKKFLLKENFFNPVEKLKDANMFVEINDQSGDITIFLNQKRRNSIFEIAHITMIKNDRYGNCNGAFEIVSSGIERPSFLGKGWGSFIYSLALEYAAMQNSPLISDRQIISQKALKMWDALYNNKNSGFGTPVQIDQLDDKKSKKENRLTPDYLYDDCGESYENSFEPPFFPRLEDDKEKYLNNPLTKSYKALSTNNLQELESAGYLIYTKAN